jgi:hypothetical protein
MSTSEIEFELSAQQFERMGYPGLKQGESLTLMLDAGVLLPDPGADSWFAVQKDRLPPLFKQVGAATYVFSGQIKAADISKENGEESAVVLVDCGGIPLLVTCAPQEDGTLPYGTWETRYLTGYSRIQGVVEDDFATPIGQTIGVIVWGFRRLILTPGDPVIGEWYEMDVLPSTPYLYDRVLVTAHLHRGIV